MLNVKSLCCGTQMKVSYPSVVALPVVRQPWALAGTPFLPQARERMDTAPSPDVTYLCTLPVQLGRS